MNWKNIFSEPSITDWISSITTIAAFIISICALRNTSKTLKIEKLSSSFNELNTLGVDLYLETEKLKDIGQEIDRLTIALAKSTTNNKSIIGNNNSIKRKKIINQKNSHIKKIQEIEKIIRGNLLVKIDFNLNRLRNSNLFNKHDKSIIKEAIDLTQKTRKQSLKNKNGESDELFYLNRYGIFISNLTFIDVKIKELFSFYNDKVDNI